MSNLATFDFESNAVRSVMIDGAPWFVGKDVCRCLEITDHHQAIERLSDDEKLGGYNIPTQSRRGGRTATVVSEPGVYRLVFTSRSESAERFKRWLAHDVLPALRKTGRYSVSGAAPDPISETALDDHISVIPLIREWRLLYGRRVAKNMVRLLPIPQINVEGVAGLADVPDEVINFAAECIDRAEGQRIGATELFDAYQAWCDEFGVSKVSQTAFGRRIKALGYAYARISGYGFYLDASLIDRE